MDSMVKDEVRENHVSNYSESVGGYFRRLPSEILRTIALMLPITSIIQLRRSSKFWYDLLTDPEFVDLHSTQSLQKPPDYLFIPDYKTPRVNPEVFSLALSDLGRSTHTTSKIFEFSTTRDHDLLYQTPISYIRGWIQSSGGLICAYARESNYFRVFNPHTNEEVKIPGNPKFKKYREVKYFFSYSPSTKEYKILKLGCLSDFSTVGAICTLGSNIWTKIRDVPRMGDIHSFAECQGNLFFWTYMLVFTSFDIVTEKFRLIPDFQNHLPHDLGSSSSIISVGDTVGFAHYNSAALWVLRDKTKGIWTRIEGFSIPRPSFFNFDVAGVLENCGVFGFMKSSRKVFRHDVGGSTELNVTKIIINNEDGEETGWTSVTYVGNHVGSLVSPVGIMENGRKLYRKRKWVLDRLQHFVDDDTKDDLFDGVYQLLNAYEEQQSKEKKTKSTTVFWEKN